MALIDTIDGIPAYSTIQEALNWGSQYNITTYHTHLIAGEIVYMAGATHDEVTTSIRLGVTSSSIGGGSSSGGGGGGY